jgi:tRNA A-37 threonylcarbamoyl transferase component Bud32
MASLIGKMLGRYQIVEQLGEGGMALVYKACDTRLDRYVAIKIIRQDAFNSPMLDEMMKRFEREARALAKLSHPNIVPVYDYGEYEGAPYLVMEYIPGGVLNLKRSTPMPWQEAVRIILPIAQARAYAHEQNIVHRDIKPSNILITGRGLPLLSDFGIAKILESDENATLTGAGMTIGTPDYMAPEQWTGQASPKSDIYSLGVVLYELVTGHKPYTADTPVAIMLKQINDPLSRPRQFSPDLPEELENMLVKALAKKPDDRFPTMGEFAAGLELLAGGQTLPVGAQLEVREEDNTLQAYRAEKPEKEKATRLAADGGQPSAGAIPNIPMPPDEQTRSPSRGWLWGALGGLVVLCLLGVALGVTYLNQAQKIRTASPVLVTASATPSLLATPNLLSVPISVSSAALAIISTLTLTPTMTMALTPTSSQITVLWDVSHGPRISSDGLAYTPDGLYKSLVQSLSTQKFVFSSGGLSGIDSYSILVLSASSADQMPYTSSEADQIEQFVRVAGHGLLIMSDIPGFENHLETVSQRFGIDLGKTTSNGPVRYSKDLFFSGVSSIQFLFGGGVLNVSSPAVAAAWDQNGNPVIAYCECDAGRVIVVADSNLWDSRGFNQAGNQQFASNVFQWLARLSP